MTVGVNGRYPLPLTVGGCLYVVLRGHLATRLVVLEPAGVLDSRGSDPRRCGVPLLFVARGIWRILTLQQSRDSAESAIFPGDRERLPQLEGFAPFAWSMLGGTCRSVCLVYARCRLIRPYSRVRPVERVEGKLFDKCLRRDIVMDRVIA